MESTTETVSVVKEEGVSTNVYLHNVRHGLVLIYTSSCLAEHVVSHCSP